VIGTRCTSCGTELAPGVKSCPVCHALVHADRLKELAAQAEVATAAGDASTAMARWNEALELLPSDVRQYAVIVEKVKRLEQAPAAGARPAREGSWLRRSWGAVVAFLALALSKGKLLLTGLLKAPTLFSLLASLGIYWAAWGWRFAAGLVATTYVHEMGHVAALVRFGIKASPPMFVPGFGAFVRLRQALPSVGQDARVGLAGPIWGLAAGLFCYAIGRWQGSGAWLAVAQFTGFVNLFNLIPVWHLDGGRAFHALSRVERWVAVAILLGTWYFRHEGLLILLALGAAWQAVSRGAPKEPDNAVLAVYAGLVIALSWLTTIPVPRGALSGG
jgi:Zn-dependent protease